MSKPVTKIQKALLLRLPPFLGFPHPHPRDITLPITMGFMATLLKQSGRSVTLLDLWATPEISLKECIKQIHIAAPDIIFFECSAGAVPMVVECARRIRASSSALLAAFHSVPTFLPERILGPDLPFDVGIIGESEETTLALVEALEAEIPLHDVAGLVYWDGNQGQMIHTPERPLIADLDALPLIDYDLLNMDHYYMYSFPMPRFRQVRWGQMLAGRGCPYACTHCSFDHRQSYGKPLRLMSPKRVVDTMEHLHTRYRINAISIEDDCFTLNADWVRAICHELNARKLNLVWVAQTRIDLVSPDLLQTMKAAGCVGLSYGIESGSDAVLKRLNKGFSREQALQGIRWTQDQGLMMRLLLMVGHPGETAEEIAESINLVLHAKAITVQVHICTPYPGTCMQEESPEALKGVQDFSSYNTISKNLSALSDKELLAWQRRFYAAYYFRPAYCLLFFRQCLIYISGSWRRHIPLIARALWYLLWESRRRPERNIKTLVDE